ncbi:MAG TPA: Gfo/Idh/MocA family oxidoreductase [Bryobacteraceae bacterium]|nr:Gfo/Idh/MocA family oxidoreductase [Bryobacteraceae bacterium]
MADRLSRRHFFYGSLLAGAVPAAGFGSVASLKRLGYKSPNEKLNIAAIGAGGKGNSDIAGCSSENIVAFADPDEKRAEKTFKAYPKVPKYKDFRRMFDKEANNIDAVLVSCPDHMHATASMWAMARGKHVYCQKPLTRTVWEAQQLTMAAERYGVATQMGNQGYSRAGARDLCEIVWSGDIGDVTEVHAWTDRPDPHWPQGPDVVPAEAAVPSTLDWDVWLGGSEMRPYSPAYLPLNWRAYPDFGCGAIGDMACHILGTPNMALRLGPPLSVERVKIEGKSKYTFPYRTVIRFDFPARGAMAPVKLFWYDRVTEQPKFEGVPEGELLGDKLNASLFIGSKGMVATGCYGGNTSLVPAAKMKDYTMPPQMLTRSPGPEKDWIRGHYRDWLRACKGGTPACSNFGVAGPFVQWMLLGVIAMRYEGKLMWDAEKGRFSNNNDANQYLRPKFRKGWKFV